MVPVLQEKSYFSEIVLQNVPWKLLELSRNKRKFNIITNYTNYIFNYFPYKIIFFLFRCYGNQASLKFVKKSWTNLMDTTFEALYKRSMSYYFNIYIYEKKSCLEVVFQFLSSVAIVNTFLETCLIRKKNENSLVSKRTS